MKEKVWKQTAIEQGILQELEKVQADRGSEEQLGVRKRCLQAKNQTKPKKTTTDPSGTGKLTR